MIGRYWRRIAAWGNFYAWLDLELKVFVYFLALLCLFRLLFICYLHDYMGGDTSFGDIGTALFYGWKLSLQSAGVLTAVSAGAGVSFYLFAPRYMTLSKKVLGGFYVIVLTLLFCGRIPYYKQFLSGYNQLIFNTFNEDVYALLISLTDQFHLPLRLLAAFIAAFFLYKAFVWWLKLPPVPLPAFRAKRACLLFRICLLALLYQGCLLVRFGGGMSYAGDVGWENAGVTKDTLLNEAILDDMQALYRAYEMEGRLRGSTGLAYTPEDVKRYAGILTGKDAGGDLDAYLQKTALGGQRAKHIFLIVSESYANWPLLPKYADLRLAGGVKALMARPDCAYSASFLPNGMSTVSGVMGIVTGLADANLYLTTMPEAYEAPYSTAIAPQFKKLGYRADFWYAGPPSWERIKDFSLAQGFDRFHGVGDYPGGAGNVWGCDDEVLYEAVLAGADAKEAGFHIILNVSNHSPFTVDLKKAGFDEAALRAALPEDLRADEGLIKELGHFWYADKMLAAFVAKAEQKYPDSLFVIVGDHADRVNACKSPDMYERYAIPFIAVGKGVRRDSFSEGAAGSHIDVAPTLLELVAPRGFVYYSVGKSLTRGNLLGVNYGFWISGAYMGKTDGAFLPEAFRDGRPPDERMLRDYINAVRSISWWRGKYGGAVGGDA